MRPTFIVFAVVLFIVFTSCEYEPKGLFERNLNKDVSAPEIETVELDLSEDQDIIDLMYNRVYFNFKSSDQRIKLVNFYLDGSLVGTVKSGKGFYDLSDQYLYQGTHKLKLEILASSGTGSIADSLAVEGFVFTSKEWTIRVKYVNHSNVTTTAENGFLKLRWEEEYDRTVQFIIYRNNKEIGKTINNEFIDTSYVGEGAEYRVNCRDKEGDIESGIGYVILPNEIDFELKADVNNNYAIDWSKFKYYAAIGSVTVYSFDDYSDYFKIKEETNPELKRSPLPTSDFGLVKLFKVKFTPKYQNPAYNPSQTENSPFMSPRKYCMVGYPFPIFDQFNHLNKTEFLYHTSEYSYENSYIPDTLYRFSVSENKIKGRTRYSPPGYGASGSNYYNITISPDGKNYLAYIVISDKVIYGNSFDFKSYKIINVSSVNTGVQKIPISNEGTGILQDFYNKYLYDFKNDKVLASIKNSTAYQDIAISSDGRYFILKDWSAFDLYEYSNNTIIKVNHYYTEPSLNYAQFFPDDPHKMLCWSKETKKMEIISCPDFGIIKSFDVEENEILDVDYSTNRILTFSDKLLVVRSLEDGTVQYKISVGFTHWDKHKCYLAGNSIFHELGGRYFLN